ncbi:MAG: class I SAM-dependent methyltransferase [Firmicutes bacterium]|nr:class I SAM-dependent methyltransferase [Bacillota bacterium]
MPGLRELLKRVLYKISPVYRNLLYLRFELENIDSRLKLMQEKQNNLEEFNYKMIVEINDSINKVTEQTDFLQNSIKYHKNQLNNVIEKEDYIKELFDITNYKLEQYLKPQNERFTDHYEYWRAKRITAIVEHFGEGWFKGKKILELGCGYGDIGYVFMSLGAEVIFAEGRAENCDYLRRRFPNNQVYCMNCENEWPFAEDIHFDLVLHMGLLYHLDSIWFVLDKACLCSDYMVLETEVSDSNDENYILKIDENIEGWDQSLIGHGSRPSANYIEKHLESIGWKYERVTDSRCNAHFHIYDWEVENSGTWRDGLRRFWFCKKGDAENA